MKKKLVLVVPCYNEEEVIEYTSKKLLEKIKSLAERKLISDDSGICFVNDGSTDKTFEILNNLADINKKILLINLTRNFGHQYAILAGVKTVNADIIITLDADLQDSLDAIDEMIENYYKGYEIVYGVREKRLNDDIFKKTTALIFYKIMKFLYPKLIYNHADFRLMSRKAISLLNEYSEKEIFLRGMIPSIGLKSTKVIYNRAARIGGTVKYNYIKMLQLAWIGITNYSVFPLRIVLFTGIILMFIAIIFIAICLYQIKNGVQNIYTFIISFMCLFSGLIMFSIGILGEYIAKILYEVKNRPPFQIDNTKNI